MKPLGRGRIVLWEGASLWAFDVPRTPTFLHSTKAHAHHALQLTFSVGGHFSFNIGEEEVAGPAVLIAPDVPHVYSAEGRNIILFVEPESAYGAALLSDLGGRPFMVRELQGLAGLLTEFSRIWDEPRLDNSTLTRMGQAAVTRLAKLDADFGKGDQRLSRVIDRLQKEPDLQMSAREAAGIACLSASRFSHLFVKEIGLPFRTYVLWLRLSVAVDRMAGGGSLTRAAHDAGFSDSAHFS